jgi:nitrate reductase NapE component
MQGPICTDAGQIRPLTRGSFWWGRVWTIAAGRDIDFHATTDHERIVRNRVRGASALSSLFGIICILLGFFPALSVAFIGMSGWATLPARSSEWRHRGLEADFASVRRLGITVCWGMHYEQARLFSYLIDLCIPWLLLQHGCHTIHKVHTLLSRVAKGDCFHFPQTSLLLFRVADLSYPFIITCSILSRSVSVISGLPCSLFPISIRLALYLEAAYFQAVYFQA